MTRREGKVNELQRTTTIVWKIREVEGKKRERDNERGNGEKLERKEERRYEESK